MKSYAECLEANDIYEPYNSEEINEMKQTKHILPLRFKRLIATIDSLSKQIEVKNILGDYITVTAEEVEAIQKENMKLSNENLRLRKEINKLKQELEITRDIINIMSRVSDL